MKKRLLKNRLIPVNKRDNQHLYLFIYSLFSNAVRRIVQWYWGY